MENAIQTNKPKRSTSSWLAIIFGILLAISVFANIILFILLVSKITTNISHSQDKYRERFIEGESTSENKVLLVPIKGIIMSKDKSGGWGGSTDIVQMVSDTLRKAEKDKKIKAVILEIDSPGGSVTASDNIHRALRRFREKRPDVVVVAYLGETAASGGYYVATPASRIVVHPTSVTGSIGVIATLINVEELFEKIGLKQGAIKSGDKKDILSWARPMTEEERDIIQAIIDEMYQRFIDIVVQGRPNLKKDDILKLADGRIYTGEQAVKNGLADESGDRLDAFEVAKRLVNITEARLIQYHRRFDFSDLFSMQVTSKTTNITTELKNLLLERNTPTLMYLWQVE
ncbi:MAG: signal peptide peptidase SppA [Planctomycetota bacterium]|nr:signal peptide peptidase SppA [Planctomycetota bacterium]MDI6787242.1 signal peptide peptidase SppA [Planctomycetota bacterium]